MSDQDILVLPDLSGSKFENKLTKEDKRYIDNSEQQQGKLMNAIESEERKVARLTRRIEEMEEYKQLMRSKRIIRALKKKLEENTIKVCGVYEKALQDVPGETLMDKLEHFERAKR